MTQNWRRCLACGVGIASFNALFMSMEHGIFGPAVLYIRCALDDLRGSNTERVGTVMGKEEEWLRGFQHGGRLCMLVILCYWLYRIV